MLFRRLFFLDGGFRPGRAPAPPPGHGPGPGEGLAILSEIKKATGLPVLTDIHEPGQAAS